MPKEPPARAERLAPPRILTSRCHVPARSSVLAPCSPRVFRSLIRRIFNFGRFITATAREKNFLASGASAPAASRQAFKIARYASTSGKVFESISNREYSTSTGSSFSASERCFGSGFASRLFWRVSRTSEWIWSFLKVSVPASLNPFSGSESSRLHRQRAGVRTMGSVEGRLSGMAGMLSP